VGDVINSLPFSARYYANVASVHDWAIAAGGAQPIALWLFSCKRCEIRQGFI